jgi:heme-degrading monooxygenase HmoA
LILRIVRGRVTPGCHTTVRAGLRASFSRVRELDGILQAHMALRSAAEGNDFAVISTWTTPDAARAVFGRNADRVASIPGVTEHLDFRTVEHFEIDESMLLHTDEPPAVARIAVGSVPLGDDVEIQREIRARMGALGGEVAEAYVGRRIRDRAVEVAFVSLWAGLPSDRPLDEPIWHDVADRYESYCIEVYDEIYRA